MYSVENLCVLGQGVVNGTVYVDDDILDAGALEDVTLKQSDV